jgi:hypothetical protein
MKKVVYICDGCGKQGDERTTRKKVNGYYRSTYYRTEQVAPEGWSRVVINRKGADICSPECAGPAIDNLTKKAVDAAEKKAADAKAKAQKQAETAKAKAEKARAKLVAV